MHAPQTKTLSIFEDSLIGYATFNQSIVYVTQSTINIINVHSIKESAPINGKNVINFALSFRNEVVILYKQKYIEVRRVNRLKEVINRIEGVSITQDQEYPLLKILNQQLYLVYPSAVEIVSLKDSSRTKYTELISEPEYHKIYDFLLLNLIQSLSIAVLQLKNRIVVAIIPCIITEMHIQGLTHVLCLHPNPSVMHPKTTYLAMLAQDTLIKIFDLTGLKQIAEIQLPSIEGFVEIQADPQSEYILVHYLHRETCTSLHNFVYKINSLFFYNENRSEEAPQQFILYHFQIQNQEYLSPLTFHHKGSFHTYSFYYFKNQQLKLIQASMPNNELQTQAQMQSITDFSFWKENAQWKDIINTYLQIEEEGIGKNSKKMIYSEEQRQLEQYYQISKDFDLIVGQFTSILAQKSQKHKMSQKQVEQQWEKYLQNVAKERNFLKETMSLFKLDYTVMKEPEQENGFIGIELETCMKEIEGRESRVDAKIRQKKLQLEQEEKQMRERPKISEADIQKEQEEYNKFVSEYLANIEKRQAQQILKSKQKSQSQVKNEELNSNFLKLQLPKLNEEEKKLIQHKSLDLSRMSSFSSHKEEPEAQHSSVWQQFQLILKQIQQEVSPLQEHLQCLIDKVDRLEHSSFQKIKQNESTLKEQMNIDLQFQVKKNCKVMLSQLSNQIKQQMSQSMDKLHKLEQKSLKQNETTIQKFKEYAKMQVRHRIQIYHRSRRQLQLKAHNIAKGQIEETNKIS